MPTYTRCTVAELRDVCTQRNLQCDGLTKREMVASLMEYDSQIIDTVAHPDCEDVASDGQSSETGDEVDGRSHDDDSVITGPGPDVAGRQESESVLQLRLRLALIQEERLARERECEIEQERMAMNIPDYPRLRHVQEADLTLKKSSPYFAQCKITMSFRSLWLWKGC